MPRPRQTDTDRTARRQIDVASAFQRSEVPTRPAVRELVPLDAVLVLAHTRSEMPWDELNELETQLLQRVDGRARAMDIVNGNAVTPGECASELASLARRGLLRLEAPVPFDGPDAISLEIDLTTL
jgi:hypothetical protein